MLKSVLDHSTLLQLILELLKAALSTSREAGRRVALSGRGKPLARRRAAFVY